MLIVTSLPRRGDQRPEHVHVCQARAQVQLIALAIALDHALRHRGQRLAEPGNQDLQAGPGRWWRPVLPQHIHQVSGWDGPARPTARETPAPGAAAAGGAPPLPGGVPQLNGAEHPQPDLVFHRAPPGRLCGDRSPDGSPHDHGNTDIPDNIARHRDAVVIVPLRSAGPPGAHPFAGGCQPGARYPAGRPRHADVVVAVPTVVGSLLADVAYAVLDPRVRYVNR